MKIDQIWPHKYISKIEDKVREIEIDGKIQRKTHPQRLLINYLMWGGAAESGGIWREGLCQETLIPFLLNIDLDGEESVIRSFGHTFVALKLVISSFMEYPLY